MICINNESSNSKYKPICFCGQMPPSQEETRKKFRALQAMFKAAIKTLARFAHILFTQKRINIRLQVMTLNNPGSPNLSPPSKPLSCNFISAT